MVTSPRLLYMQKASPQDTRAAHTELVVTAVVTTSPAKRKLVKPCSVSIGK